MVLFNIRQSLTFISSIKNGKNLMNLTFIRMLSKVLMVNEKFFFFFYEWFVSNEFFYDESESQWKSPVV